jgi:hypothetical protein
MMAVEPAHPRIPHPHSGGVIRHGMCGTLRVRVWCAITPISPLSVVVLRLGTASLDPLKDLAHGSLCNPV